MKKTFLFLKKSLYIPILILGLITNALTVLFKTSSLLKEIALSKFNISIILIILFFLIRQIGIEIPNKKKENSGEIVNAYSDKVIKLAILGKYLAWSFLLVPLIFLLVSTKDFFVNRNLEEQSCNRKLIGIIIAKFSKSADDDDDFSNTLYGTLNSRLQDVDSINLIPLNKYISEGPHYKDTIKEEFNKNCSDTGLLVFGKRKDSQLISSKLFYCRISALNFFNKKTNQFETNNKTIIYIKNPDNLEFSIEYEADAISTFIFGLIYNRAGNYDLSNRYLDSALTLNRNKENKAFIADCHLFKGDNLLGKGKLQDAINEYQLGIQNDSTNAFLHYNLAALYKQINDDKNAIKEYKVAHLINSSLINPIIDKDSTKTYSFGFIGQKKILNLDTSDLEDNTSPPLPKSEPDMWDESCSTIENEITHKWGVINNKQDTIVDIIYDGLEYFTYKNMDCFIVNYRGKYGAVIHKHINTIKYRYAIYKISPIYSMYKAKELSENWIDNNQNAKIDN